MPIFEQKIKNAELFVKVRLHMAIIALSQHVSKNKKYIYLFLLA
jgi:hypothetical protein